MNDTAVYEVINPSDPITFRATPDEAAVITRILGGSMLFVRGADDMSPGSNLDDQAVAEMREALWADAESISSYASAWDSFLIGSRADRDLYEAAVATMTPEQASTYREQWHAKRRTSMNDICARSWAAAEDIAAEMPTPVSA